MKAISAQLNCTISVKGNHIIVCGITIERRQAMLLTLRESDRIAIARDALVEMTETGNLWELHVPANYNAATDCLADLRSKTHTAETITEDVARWYSIMGFTVRPKGIGWQIAPSIRVLNRNRRNVA